MRKHDPKQIKRKKKKKEKKKKKGINWMNEWMKVMEGKLDFFIWAFPETFTNDR